MTPAEQTESIRAGTGAAEPAGDQRRRSWYEDFFAGLDAMDRDALVGQFTSDTTVSFANHEPTEGRDAVLAALEHFWSTIAGMKHEVVSVLEDGERATIESRVTYTRQDGSQVAIPAATAFERRDGLIASHRIYVDLAPLHATPASR